MSDAELISTLNTISLYLNKIVPVILLIAGTFGHICNIIIFSKRTQRTNPIAIYFLSSTIANIVVLYIGVFVRYLQDNYSIDPVNNISAVCRIRSFLFYSSLSLSNWYILLATIDRYLISSDNNHRRQLSSLKNAYRIIIIITITFILLYCHILILYNIQTYTNASNYSQNYCYPQRDAYRIFSDIQLLVQFSLLPPILMSIFIIMIIKNIRTSHRRIANTVVAHHHARIRKRDLQLSKMLLLQVIITIVCSLPLAISQLLTTMTLTWTKTALRLTVEGFFSLIGRHLAFTNCAISFYIYTLAGSQFRLEIRDIINNASTFVCGKRLLENSRIGIANENAHELPIRKQPNEPSKNYQTDSKTTEKRGVKV
ncbi:hypothetical protein I4U23_007298 [Adineta vaga]|nr:hypothetical protein I4U23_007298 [Adineta vaga]